jgi:catechol 2,3-dioxygenase-like lactoylglutathione lyase family enzyme
MSGNDEQKAPPKQNDARPSSIIFLRPQERAMLQNFPLYAYIPAKDVARARQFYEGKLGFRPKQEIAGGVVYEFGEKTACFLYPTPNAGTSRASQAFWQVDDVEREVAELKARGVEFENYDMPGKKSPSGVVEAGGAKAAWFKDSEGNILAIVQDA